MKEEERKQVDDDGTQYSIYNKKGSAFSHLRREVNDKSSVLCLRQ